MRGKPSALNNVFKSVADVFEVKIQPHSSGGRHHPVAVENDKLALIEQLHVALIMACLEALLIREGRKAGHLQGLHLRCEFGARMRDRKPLIEMSVVPTHLFPSLRNDFLLCGVPPLALYSSAIPRALHIALNRIPWTESEQATEQQKSGDADKDCARRG